MSYGAPTVSGGLAPVTITCTPESGTSLDVGTTTVTCNASDSIGQGASCMLSVVVLSQPQLLATKFLAFGDSLTAGVTSTPIQGVVQLEPHKSYPFKVQAKLAQRYLMQFIDVVNAGAAGEDAALAVSRFQSRLAQHQPEVVLLMEGANDLGDAGAGAGAAAAADALETMVVSAKAAGSDLILATLPPQRSVRDTATLVQPFNDLVRAIATRQQVPLVDVYTVINTGQCATFSMLPTAFQSAGAVQRIDTTIPCIGDDHLHPTEEGYDLMAEAFVDRIVGIYDVVVTPTVGRLGGPSRSFWWRSPGVSRSEPSGEW